MNLNMKNKLIALILCALFAFPAPLFAQEEPELEVELDLRLTVLEPGQAAPYPGFLLTFDAMNKIKMDNELKIALLENEMIFAKGKFDHEINMVSNLWTIERELFQDRLGAKDEYIAKLEKQTIDGNDWTMIYVVSAFLAGSLMTVGMAYALGGAK